MPLMEEGVGGDFESLLRALSARIKSEVWTALPGVVNKWNYPSSGMSTVQVTPGVQQMKLDPDSGIWMATPMPAHDDVPVHYLGGGGFYFTHPIGQGDEGILIYSARCIDSWWQQGGVQPRPSYGQFRTHDLSDAMFIPTRMSNKNILPSISQTSSQLRSIDGKSYFEFLPDGTGFNWVTPNGYMKLDGSGNLTCSGNIRGFDQTGYVDLLHTHNQPPDNAGDIEATTNPPNRGT